MSTYDELTGTAARIADAAIEWDMADRGWHKSDEGWISDISVAPVSTYVLSHDGFYVRIVGEDGWLKSDEFAGTAETDFRAVWQDWYERIFDLFLERSEEHTSELQSLMRNSYAVFCLKHKK